jgi:surface-anchored protein
MKLKSLILASSIALLPAVAPAAINFSGGGADLTFFYDSQADSWATVFRAKGTAGQPTTAIASGLTSAFNSTSTPATWTGIVGNVVAGTNGHTGDYTFSSLTTSISTSTSILVGSTNYFVAAASGSPFLASGTADLGIRTRLREDEVAMGDIDGNTESNQFDSFNLVLELGASTFNGNALDGNAHISLLFWDSFENPIALIDTANSSLTANFGNNAHVHRNWGFSEYGTYELVFDLQGVGGTYGGSASTGTTSMTFEVVPEPATFALISGLLAFGLIAFRRCCKA